MAYLAKKDLYYPELSYKLNGLFFKTCAELGKFKLERHYCNKIAELLTENKIKFVREKDLKNIFDKIELEGNIPDFIIENCIIVDAKHKPILTKKDYYQMMRYLEIADLPLGIIVNFRANYVSPKRIVNNKFSGRSSNL